MQEKMFPVAEMAAVKLSSSYQENTPYNDDMEKARQLQKAYWCL